jgi:hypothetical protein
MRLNLRKHCETNGKLAPDMSARFELTASWLRCLLVAFGLISGSRSEAGSPEWVQRYDQEVGSEDRTFQVVADSEGNFIVGGFSDEGKTGRDILLIKYSGTGLPIWTNRYDGPAHLRDQATAMAVGRNGEVFVTGISAGSVNSVTHGGTTSQNPDYDYVILGYSGSGIPMWTNRYRSVTWPFYDRPHALAEDGRGSIIVTGQAGNGTATVAYTSDGVPLWTNVYALITGAFGKAVVIDRDTNTIVVFTVSSGLHGTIVYSMTGAPLWTNRYSGVLSAALAGVAATPEGNIVVTGQSSGDHATIAYSSAGQPLWTNRYDTFQDEVPQAIAADQEGNVIIAGTSGPSWNNFLTTIAYNRTGVPLWTNEYRSNGFFQDAKAVALDSSGNAFVAGYFFAEGRYDYVTIAYSSGGVALWTNLLQGSAYFDHTRTEIDSRVGIAVSRDGKACVTGYTSNDGQAHDSVVVAYEIGGQSAWTNLYNAPASGRDEATAMAVDCNGEIFVTGASVGRFTTIAYSSNGNPKWTNSHGVARTGPDDFYSDPEPMIAVSGDRVFVTGASPLYSYLSDFATIAYTSDGAPLWTNFFNGAGNQQDDVAGLAADSRGNLFVAGSTFSSRTNEQGSYSDPDYVTIAYSGSGTPLWTNYYNGFASEYNAWDYATGISVDSEESIIVSGTSSGSFVTVKYSNNGVPLWTNRHEVVGNGFHKMIVDKTGNVVLSGSGPIVSLSKEGLLLWTNECDAPTTSLAVDEEGNVFVAGPSYRNETSLDYAVFAYSQNGLPLWTNRYNGPTNSVDYPAAITIDSGGNVVVTGWSIGSAGYTDYVTIWYSRNGVPLWTNRYSGVKINSGGNAIVADKCGNIFVTGYLSSGSTTDFGTIKYAGGAGPKIRISRLGNDIVLSWPSGCTDFLLQQSSSIQSPSWSDVMEPSLDNGVSKSVSVPGGPGKKFFRLSR